MATMSPADVWEVLEHFGNPSWQRDWYRLGTPAGTLAVISSETAVVKSGVGGCSDAGWYIVKIGSNQRPLGPFNETITLADAIRQIVGVRTDKEHRAL